MKKIAWILVLWGLPLWAAGQGGVVVRLPEGGFRPATPAGFQIVEVKDQRPRRGDIGQVARQGQLVPIQVQGGLLPALSAYLRGGPARRQAAIVISVRELLFQDKISGRQVQGSCRLSFDFSSRRGTVDMPLTTYGMTVNYAYTIGSSYDYQQTLERMIQQVIGRFGQWMDRNRNQMEGLAARVELRFRPMPLAETADTVFYSVKRPVRWDDFRGPVRMGPGNYGAAIQTSFGYEAVPRVENGVVVLDVLVKVYMLREQSWKRPGLTATHLAHEQLHFDIAYLIGERFKKALLAEELPVEDYDSRMQYIFLDFYRELHTLQKQYDAETQHSLIATEQARWERKIAEELRALR